ncbi:MAG: hypothetical protein HY064_01370 [Bacteroidetes bacterium]|nr:hypothetical protein [Bacteroidota bacterium]
MKKILPLFLCIGFIRCSDAPKTNATTGSSTEIEKATLACWSSNWSREPGYDISIGLNLMDDYLFAKGYLGKRTVADYKRFLTSDQVIEIPDSVAGSEKMRLALNSDFGSEPNVAGMIACWKANWFGKISTIDSTDVIARTGKLVQELSESGPPDVTTAAQKFFTGLTDADMKRQLVKNISYFIFWKNQSGQTHIIISHPDVMSGDSATIDLDRKIK